MTRTKSNRRQLPEAVPGTEEELDAITSTVLGVSARGRERVEAGFPSMSAELQRLASRFLEGMRQMEAAPSVKELEAQLEQLAQFTRKLKEALSRLPPFFLEAWNAQIFTGDNTIELAASGINGVVEDALRTWRDGWGPKNRPSNRRGPQNSFRRQKNDPRAELATEIAELILQKQGPDKITAEEGGPIQTATVALWTYATGFPEEGANLRQFVRRAARYARFHWRSEVILQEMREIRRLASEAHTDPHTQRNFKRRIRILDADYCRFVWLREAAAWTDELNDVSILYHLPPTVEIYDLLRCFERGRPRSPPRDETHAGSCD